jgi:hypothetical protein
MLRWVLGLETQVDYSHSPQGRPTPLGAKSFAS